MRRLVLDSSVIVSAFRSRRGASSRLLRLAEESRIVPLATLALFLEYEEVLKRPEQREASGFTLPEVDTALAAFAGLIEPVKVRFTWRPQLKDADDEMVLEAAVNGRADALVTHNVADFAPATRTLGLLVVSPGELLKRVGG